MERKGPASPSAPTPRGPAPRADSDKEPRHAQSGGMRWLVPAIAVTGILFGGSLIALRLVGSRTERPAPGATPLTPDVEGLLVPAFTLTDQDGHPVTQEVLDGGVTIVDFMFTHCTSVCPAMSAAMQGVSEQLAGIPVRFLSVSVDPEHDTPATLKAYAGRLGADLGRWSFLTGDGAAITHLVRDGIGFALETNDKAPITLEDGSTMANIVHPSKLVLIGPHREVLGMYGYEDQGQMDRLTARARAAALQLGLKDPVPPPG